MSMWIPAHTATVSLQIMRLLHKPSMPLLLGSGSCRKQGYMMAT